MRVLVQTDVRNAGEDVLNSEVDIFTKKSMFCFLL